MTRQNPHGSGGILLLAGAGALVYYAYSKGYFGQIFTTSATTTTTGGGSTTTGGTTTPPVGSPSYNSLAAIYQRLVGLAGANTVQTPDAWNYDLATVQSVANPLPPPEVVWTDSSFDRNVTMTLAQYWSGMSAYLHQNAGLSALMGGYA